MFSGRVWSFFIASRFRKYSSMNTTQYIGKTGVILPIDYISAITKKMACLLKYYYIKYQFKILYKFWSRSKTFDWSRVGLTSGYFKETQNSAWNQTIRAFILRDNYCTVAWLVQSLDHETLNLRVVGLSPTLGDIYSWSEENNTKTNGF